MASVRKIWNSRERIHELIGEMVSELQFAAHRDRILWLHRRDRRVWGEMIFAATGPFAEARDASPGRRAIAFDRTHLIGGFRFENSMKMVKMTYVACIHA